MGIAGTETQWKEGGCSQQETREDQSNWNTVREL